MTDAARDLYLETEVRTATPQRLQLMLVEGALRFARQAEDAWSREGQQQSAYNALVRCRDVVAQIYGAIRQDADPLARKVAAVYLFLFTQLAEIPAKNDPAPLNDVIRVLEEEKITWETVCRQMPEPPANAHLGSHGRSEITSSDAASLSPPPSNQPEPPDSFSLEA